VRIARWAAARLTRVGRLQRPLHTSAVQRVRRPTASGLTATYISTQGVWASLPVLTAVVRKPHSRGQQLTAAGYQVYLATIATIFSG